MRIRRPQFTEEEIKQALKEAVACGLLEVNYSDDGEALYQETKDSQELLQLAHKTADKLGINASSMTNVELLHAVAPYIRADT